MANDPTKKMAASMTIMITSVLRPVEPGISSQLNVAFKNPKGDGNPRFRINLGS
jgi:hypothetical protein